jgi:hypothetical protein
MLRETGKESHETAMAQGVIASLPGTFWIKSQTSGLKILTPSISVTAKIGPE